MKQLLSFSLIFAVLLTGCKQECQRLRGLECFENQHRVFICYDDEIEGYEVGVMLLPELRNGGNSCQAIIDLRRDTCHWQFVHSAFVDTLGFGRMARDTVIHMRHEARQTEARGKVRLGDLDTAPFFFLDVDFDGRKELVLSLYQQGQHWSNALQPVHIGYDYLYENLKDRPFTKMDALTEIDFDNHTITLTSEGGMSYWTCDVYKFRPADASELDFPVLLEHYREEHDSGEEPRVRRIVCREDTLGWKKK